MEKFLTTALAPKAKRKAAPADQKPRNGPRVLDRTSTAASKRPRLQQQSSSSSGSASTTTAKEKEKENDRPSASASVAAALPSFRDVVAGQGAAAGRASAKLYEQARAMEQEGRYEDACKMLLRALVACACHDEIRHYYTGAGGSLGQIDPIGKCTCRNFVEAAQTRRARSGPLASSSATAAAAAATANNSSAGPGRGNNSSSLFPISELDLTAVYRLATKEEVCVCGSGRMRCTQSGHLDVLDRLAAVAIKLGRTGLATEASQWLIQLAPDRAQGYLNLAKAVLLAEERAYKNLTSVPSQTSSQTPPQPLLPPPPRPPREASQAKARFAALCLYNQGRHAVRAHGDPESPFLDILDRCCRQYSRGDFLPQLPLEMAEAILQHLSLPDIVRCQRVSRTWAAMLKRVRLRLAAVVRLPGTRFFPKKKRQPQRQPPNKSLHALMRAFPGLQAQHVLIRFPQAPGFGYKVFVEHALRYFHGHLESVELDTWWAGANPPYGVRAARLMHEPDWPQLTVTPSPMLHSGCRKLVLHGPQHHHYGYQVTDSANDIRGIIAWASASLEHLELHGDRDVDGLSTGSGFFVGTIDFPLPRLRILKVTNSPWSYYGRRATLPSICRAAPQLEQLWLEDVAFYEWAPTARVDTDWDGQPLQPPLPPPPPPAGYDEATVLGLLPSLHTIYIGPGCRPSYGNVHDLWSLFPRLPASMRCIDITSKNDWVTNLVLLRQASTFPVLEAFRCLSPAVEPKNVFAMLQPSLNGADGRLAHLEVSGWKLKRDFLDGTAPYYHFQYPERLRTIGLYEFDWDRLDDAMAGRVRGGDFVTWVSQFRNAETICMYPAWQDTEAWMNRSDIQCGAPLMLLVERIAQIARREEEEEEEGGGPGEEGKTNEPKPVTWSKMRLRSVYQGLLRGAMHGVLQQWQEKTFGKQLIDFPQGHKGWRPPVFPWPDGR